MNVDLFTNSSTFFPKIEEEDSRKGGLKRTIQNLADKVFSLLRAAFSFIGSLFFCFRKARSTSKSAKKPIDPLVKVAASDKNKERVQQEFLTDVFVSNNVDETYEWKKKLLQSAKSSIEWSLNFGGGEKLQEILSLLEKQMKKESGLAIHLIISSDLLNKENKKTLKELRKKNRNKFHYLITDRQFKVQPSLHSEENHEKLLLVDGKYFAGGGSGVTKKMCREEVDDSFIEIPDSLADTFVAPSFRDTDVIGKSNEDKFGRRMRRHFFYLYQIWATRMERPLQRREGVFFSIKQQGICQTFEDYQDRGRNVPTKFIFSGPEQGKDNLIEQEIVKQINEATEKVIIANHLFNPSKKIRIALKSKNIEKIGIFNGAKYSVFNHLFTMPYYDILSTGYEYNKENQLYHKKIMITKKITDNGTETTSTVGTYNFGKKSKWCDYENVFVFKSDLVAEQLIQGIEEDKQYSVIVDPSKIETDSYKTSLKLFIKELFQNFII